MSTSPLPPLNNTCHPLTTSHRPLPCPHLTHHPLASLPVLPFPAKHISHTNYLSPPPTTSTSHAPPSRLPSSHFFYHTQRVTPPPHASPQEKHVRPSLSVYLGLFEGGGPSATEWCGRESAEPSRQSEPKEKVNRRTPRESSSAAPHGATEHQPTYPITNTSHTQQQTHTQHHTKPNTHNNNNIHTNPPTPIADTTHHPSPHHTVYRSSKHPYTHHPESHAPASRPQLNSTNH